MSALGAVLTVFCLLFVLAPGFCTINHNLTPTKQTHANQIQRQRQGCDSRTRGNHARGLKNSLPAVFTWESRAVYIRHRPQIYGKYGGIGVLFGGGGSSYLQVSCVVR